MGLGGVCGQRCRSHTPSPNYATLLSGQYNIPNIFAEVISVYSNTVPVDAYRGAGRPEASFVVERLMETARRVYRSFGYLPIDTPALEYEEILTGKGGGAIGKMLTDADVHICVPAERTARIQEVHLTTIHCICDGIDVALFGGDEND